MPAVRMGRFAGEQGDSRSNGLTRWLARLRDRVLPRYVDGSSLPADPPSPYRGRLHVPAEYTPPGMEVTEREIVRGTVETVYEIRCACHRRWFRRDLERVQVCPRCGRAVLLDVPQ